MIVINDKKDCMGCHGCSNICPKNCISMDCDSEGFWYPKVDYNKCIQCGLCIKVCPLINPHTVENKPVAYACINKNETDRKESTSGGIFTLLAGQVIKKGGFVFGASFNEVFDVEHSYAKEKMDVKKFQGSKYVQSKIGTTYTQVRAVLKQGEEVLFSGTPCQIGGLKAFLGRDYDNLLTVDIVCHGVPSPKVWQKYLAFRERRAGAAARKVHFRAKTISWKRYSVLFQFEDNTEYQEPLDKDLYMKAFLKNTSLRPSCYDCAFKTIHRESDITLADFWGIENILPTMDDNKGTSLIFVNTLKGQSMMSEISKSIKIQEIDIHKAVAYNSAAVKSVAINPKREAFFKNLDLLPFDRLVKKYCIDPIYVRAIRKTINIPVRILGKLKRIFRTQLP